MPHYRPVNKFRILFTFVLFVTVMISNLTMMNLAQARERVFTYSSVIKVLPSRSLDVTETITVNVENKKIRHGIFRDFATTRINRKDQKVDVSLQIISVKRNGVKEAYHTRKQGGKIRVFFGSKDKIVSKGIQTYIFRYITDNQLNSYKNKDEFYWNASGNKWSMDIFRVEATIILPEKVRRKSISIKAYSGYSGVNKQDYVSTFQNNHTIKFALNRKYITGNGLTIAIAWPKGYIDAAKSSNVKKTRDQELKIKLAPVNVTKVVVTNNAKVAPLAEPLESIKSTQSNSSAITNTETANDAKPDSATLPLLTATTVITDSLVNDAANTQELNAESTEISILTDITTASATENNEPTLIDSEHNNPELVNANALSLKTESAEASNKIDSLNTGPTVFDQLMQLNSEVSNFVLQFNIRDYLNPELFDNSLTVITNRISSLKPADYFAVLGLILLLIYFSTIRIFLFKKDSDSKNNDTQENEHIPDDLSPASIRYIYEMGYDDRTFSIALINIAVKGHIDIIDTENSYMIERRNFSAAEQLSKDEKLLISSLMGSNSEIQLSSKNHKVIRDAMTKHQNILEADHKSKYFTTNKKWFNVGVALAVIIATAIAVFETSLNDAIIKMALISSFGLVTYISSYIILKRFKFYKNYKSALITKFLSNPEIKQTQEAYLFAIFLINVSLVVLLLNYIHPINIIALASISFLGAIMIDSLISPNMKGKNILNRIGDLKEFITQGDQLDDIAQYDSMQYSQTISAFDNYLPYTIALGVEAEWGDHYSLLFDNSDDVGYSPHWYHGSGWQENSTTSFCKSLSSKFSFSAGAAANAPKHTHEPQQQIKH